jgi:hypothetical protein
VDPCVDKFSMSLHGVTSRKNVLFIITVVKSSYLMCSHVTGIFEGNQSRFSVVGVVTILWAG